MYLFIAEENEITKKTALERWKDSLLASTNLSQVFLHLAVLDGCIVWGKSILHARCRLCRRKTDAEKMLLCDGCDRGHHIYCLKPPMKVQSFSCMSSVMVNVETAYLPK